jgi:hypothetical protein
MGNDKSQTTGSMPREASQTGTHGQTGSSQGGQGKDWSKGEGSQGKGQGQDRGQGQPMGQDQGSYQDQGNRSSGAQRDMAQGDQTKPAQPSGTSPLDKDQQPVNQNRGQQNRG